VPDPSVQPPEGRRGIYPPLSRVCGCGDLEECHNIGIRAGRKVRTNCSHAICGCRVFRPKEEQEQHR
jgi:hypothetical protein